FGLIDLRVKAGKETREIRTGAGALHEPVPCHTGKAQLVQRTRERLGKTWHAGNRREVSQLAGLHAVEDDPGGNGLEACVSGRRSGRINSTRRRTRRQLREAESRYSKRRTCLAGDRSSEIIRGAARGTNDQNLSRGGVFRRETYGSRESGRSGRGCDYSKH